MTPGKAVFVSDQPVTPITPTLLGGFAVHKLWGADETPRLPDDGSLLGYTGYFPPVGGIRFGFTTFPPGTGPQSMEGLDIGAVAVAAELEDLLPGLAPSMEPAAPGMHTSAPLTSRSFSPERSCLSSMTARR